MLIRRNAYDFRNEISNNIMGWNQGSIKKNRPIRD